MSEYPRDEFDKVPESSARQGVHRARMAPPRQGGLGLIILVGALALAIGAAAFFVAPRLGIGASAGEAPSAEPAAEAAATASPSAPAAAEETAAAAETAEPAPATTAPTEAPTEAPETPEPAPVDKALPVNVLNGTTTGGLAGTVAGRVAGDGWATGQVGNWAGQPVQTSIIFYNGPDQLASAQEISRLLNIPTLIESTAVSPQVTVVLGPGFQ
jgi:hypothetical protein